ncbi:outer membrane protein TolC [Lewinella aquimaris]|uniref:Outer membrane protein TolC n=1 Tax=Neolewinella aquimaris TaxID=1835722 RepID=A0A840EGE1_9BACT|nr:TolC family protein [Neolewinella aquimaris]MBB4080879.1 outer membrane protein TolC [Neolewinella aquimaris]
MMRVGKNFLRAVFGVPGIALVLLLPCTRVPAQTITLSELQREAAERAENVLIADQQAEAAALDLRAYEAGLKPRLDLAVSLPNYFRTSTEVTQDDGTIAFREIELNNSSVSLLANQRIAATGGLIGVETRLQRTDNFALNAKRYNGSPIRLTFRQPILAFNPWKWDRRLLPLQVTVSDRALAAARADAALDATVLFFDLVNADQERRIAETNREANLTLFAIAEERYRLGKINRGDLVQLELEQASAEQNLLRAERLVGAASAAILQFLGQAYTGQMLQPAAPETTASLTDLEITAARATEQLAARPELLEISRQILTAQREADRIKRDYGPRLDLDASIGLIRNADELDPIYSDPQSERIVSLTFAVPLVDWGERRALNKRSATEVALAQQLGQRTELNLQSQLTQLLDQWRTVREELVLATRIRDLAEERFTISQESYTLGAIPLTDLTFAQQNRDQNTRSYASTLRAYWLTYASLERLTLWDFVNDKPLYRSDGERE